MATGSPGQAALMAEFAFKQGWKKAYILQDTSTAFEASFADTFQKRWTELAGADNFLGKDTFGADEAGAFPVLKRVLRLSAFARASRRNINSAIMNRTAPVPLRTRAIVYPGAMDCCRAGSLTEAVRLSEEWLRARETRLRWLPEA